jgi:hypothetical protein
MRKADDMRIEADVTVWLDAPDEEEGEKYLDEILADISESTIINFRYKMTMVSEFRESDL